MQSKGPHQAAKLSEEDASKKTKTKIKNLAVWPLHETGNDMIFCKLMQAQSKGMKSTWSTARCSGTGRVKFQGDKKRPAKGNDLNALVVNTVKLVLKPNKCKRAKASSDSVSEDEQEHYNFETLNIGGEWQKSRMPRSNDAEIPEEGMEADKELYTISNLINPNKKKN